MILVGRFVGRRVPLVPMVAGMLIFPWRNLYWAELIGCLLWLPFYFLAGHWRSGNRYSFRYAERRFQMVAAGDGVAAVGRRLAMLAVAAQRQKRQSIV